MLRRRHPIQHPAGVDERMSKSIELIAGVGLADLPRKSRWPARMDVVISGLE